MTVFPFGPYRKDVLLACRKLQHLLSFSLNLGTSFLFVCSMYNEHEEKAYRMGHVHLSCPYVYLHNYRTDFDIESFHLFYKYVRWI
jgi:hypothetical protein